MATPTPPDGSLVLPALAEAEALFRAPAWIVSSPPVVAIAIAPEPVGETYASVVATSTTTASAALRFWSPLAVFDLPSAFPSAAAVCFDLPLIEAPSATSPEQPLTLVKDVSVLLP